MANVFVSDFLPYLCLFFPFLGYYSFFDRFLHFDFCITSCTIIIGETNAIHEATDDSANHACDVCMIPFSSFDFCDLSFRLRLGNEVEDFFFESFCLLGHRSQLSFCLF